MIIFLKKDLKKNINNNYKMSSNTSVEDKSLIPNIPATDFNPVGSSKT